MAVFTTEIPDLRFSGMYFPQIWQDLLAYRRAYMKELTDEDDNEPTIQLLKAFAAGFHYCNVLLDHAAQETLLPTAKLRESVRAHLALMGYRLLEATPASTVVLLKLGSPLVASAAVPALSVFATQGGENAPRIDFETQDAISIVRTDRITHAYAYDAASEEWADLTDFAQGTGTSQTGSSNAGDILYFGQDDVIFDALRVAVDDPGDVLTNGAEPENYYVFEYYDSSDQDTIPDAVTLDGSELKFHIDGLLGDNDRTGSSVVVRHRRSGKAEERESYYESDKNYVNTGDFDQDTVSTEPTDYIVGVKWKEVPAARVAVEDDRIDLTFKLPEGSSREWISANVNGIESYWVRLRIIRDGAGEPPALSGVTSTTPGSQYVKAPVVQGVTHNDDGLVFDGSSDQTFSTARDGVIDGSVRVFVDEGSGEIEYGAVLDFLSSVETSRHFVVSYDADARVTVSFGDGVNGYRPPSGSEVRIRYRTGADDDGNVGPGEIRVNQSSAAFITSVRNPRQASGWTAAEGSTPESLAEAKINGPASLRIKDRAITADDVEQLSTSFVAETGSSPVVRANAIVDGFGEKTFRLVVVSASGFALEQDQLDQLDLYFNGDEATATPGLLIGNYTLQSVNYTPVEVDVEVTISGGDADEVESALRNYLSPTASRSGALSLNVVPGDLYEHAFGGTLYENNLIAVAKGADASIIAVTAITTSMIGGILTLEEDELPVPGDIVVNTAGG